MGGVQTQVVWLMTYTAIKEGILFFNRQLRIWIRGFRGQLKVKFCSDIARHGKKKIRHISEVHLSEICFSDSNPMYFVESKEYSTVNNRIDYVHEDWQKKVTKYEFYVMVQIWVLHVWVLRHDPVYIDANVPNSWRMNAFCLTASLTDICLFLSC